MRFFSLIVIVLFLLVGCSPGKQDLKQGVWRGVMEMQGQQLPFNLAIIKDTAGYHAFLKNGEENLLIDEIKLEQDSFVFTMHIFDSELKVRAAGDSLRGFFIKNSEKNYRLPFRAFYNQDYRFIDEYPSFTVNGKWRVTFTNQSDTTHAVGLFEQRGNIVIGTFLTPTGDYRFLEGNVAGDTLQLSTFDGNHAYLFKASKKNDSTLVGEFWSGRSWHQQWKAIQDEKATIDDATTLTQLKKGYDKIEFSFPDINKKLISPQDEKYKNKILILQLFGTWCPNCMDETKFLTSWYKENKNRGVEIIGLAYESKDDFDYARSRVKKMIDKLNVTYDFVIAGHRDKEEASKTLPMLTQIEAFPTTIFIGKDGKVKKIHTGFSGPGTGIYYEHFIQQFNETVNELLAEDLDSTQ